MSKKDDQPIFEGATPQSIDYTKRGATPQTVIVKQTPEQTPRQKPKPDK